MHIRPKTKRRLLILFAIAGVVIGLLSVVYGISRHRNAVAQRDLRAQAMTAYRSGDFEKSVGLLQQYIESAPDKPDPEALFAFAVSRMKVPKPDDKQLFEASNAFKQYLELKPGDPAAQHELLKLYVQTSCNVEAEHLADEMLAKAPRDGEALWQKVWALVGEHHPEDALKVCQKLNDIEPENLNAQLETIDLMGQTSATPQQIIAHATALHAQHDGDPRFEVLLADAYAAAKQDGEKNKWLQTAASRTPPDAQFVLAMVSSLDSAGLYSDAAAFLQRAADSIPDPLVQRLLAQRLWQNGKLFELENRLKNQDPSSPAADGMLLGYRALALYAQNKKSEAAAIVAAMSHRTDASSMAWATALAANHASPALSTSDRVVKLQEAVIRDPQNPVLRLMLAEAYVQTGEVELAIPQCAQAFQFSRSWAMPYVIAAQALIVSGRNGDAVNTAREAWKRAPGHYETETTLAQADFALAAETGLAGDYSNMLPRLAQIQKTWHDPKTLWIYVTTLARAGRSEEATAVIKAALDASPPLAPAILTNLAEVAENEQLNVGQQVLEFARKAHGLTPEIAYTQARMLLRAGKETEAADVLRDASKGHETELPWRIVQADFDEMAGLPGALKEWIALGDEFPNDLQLQQTILHAQSRLKDRDFWARTIDRLKALTGEQALLWRIERGRWLLSGDLPERDKAEAVNILTQVTRAAPGLAEPHRLLAIAMEKVANVPGAIAELTAAADASPGDPTITRTLVELLIANNRSHDAMMYLDKLAHRPRLSDGVRDWLVHVYVQQGANERALAVLTDDKDPSADPVRHDLLLAERYRAVGHDEQAAKLYLGLLDKPIPQAGYCVEAAEFLADRRDMPSAEKFLAKLSDLKLPPGQAQLYRAQFAEQWIGLDEAFKDYQAAIAAAPQSVAAWSGLAGFHMRHSRFSDAIAAADHGLKAVPGNKPLQALRSVAVALSGLGDALDVQPLIESLSHDPLDGPATEMLGAISAAHARRLSPAETADHARAVADRHPDNMQLQSETVRAYLWAGEAPAALALAQGMANRNPNSPAPQGLLTDIYVLMGAWTKAEQAALLWREHSMGHTLGPDLALAEIYLRQPKRDPAGAERVLAPHVSSATALQNPQATELYAKALVMVDRSGDAAALLKPLITDAPHWRSVWLTLAGVQKDAQAASDWIAQVAPSIPADSQKEQVDLATAWYAVSERFDSPAALDHAEQMIKPLLAGSENLFPVYRLQGKIALARGDYAGAEKADHQALKLDGESFETMNDLAYTLWLQGDAEKLAEAQKLAEAATAARPAEAGFYDTLARVEARRGDRQTAVHTFRTALAKDPASLEAMIGLADLLSRDAATRDQAKDLIAQIQRGLEINPRLSSVLRKQYQTARDAVASTSD